MIIPMPVQKLSSQIGLLESRSLLSHLYGLSNIVHFSFPDFLIEYMDLLHQPGVWVNLTEVSGTTTTAQLELSPYIYYTFRVLAQNGVGYSDPSNPSAQYRTNPSGSKDFS